MSLAGARKHKFFIAVMFFLMDPVLENFTKACWITETDPPILKLFSGPNGR